MDKLLFPALLFLCAACGTGMHFDEQEWTLRYRAEEDALELLVVSYGVHASGSTEGVRQKAVETIEELAGGARRIVTNEDGFFASWDFEEFAQELDADEEPLVLELAEWAKHISVVRSGLCVDAMDRVGLHQTFRFGSVRELVRLANRAMNESLLETTEELLTDELDRDTAFAWIRKAEQGESWLELADGQLVFQAPMTSRTAARILSSFTRDMARSEDVALSGELAQIVRDVAASLEEIQFGGGLLMLRTKNLAEEAVTVRFRELEDSDARDPHAPIPRERLPLGEDPECDGLLHELVRDMRG